MTPVDHWHEEAPPLGEQVEVWCEDRGVVDAYWDGKRWVSKNKQGRRVGLPIITHWRRKEGVRV